MINIFLLVSLFISPAAMPKSSEVSISRSATMQASVEAKIRAHLTIHNLSGAIAEAEKAHASWPDHRPLHQLLIISYARQGALHEMFSSWKEYANKYSDAFLDREILEAMGWSVILRADDSSKPITRAIALIAASFTDHRDGLNLIKKGMKDRNAFIRALSAKIAGNLHDRILKEEVYRLATQEVTKDVRIEAIQALGKMGILKARPYLESLISSSSIDDQIRLAAIEALVQMLDTLPRERMEALVHSSNRGERFLACRAAVMLGLKRDSDLMVELLKDPSSSIRSAAIEALGILHVGDKEIVRPLLDDKHPQVAIYAAWYLTLCGEGGHLQPWLHVADPEKRHFAAGVLAYSGDAIAMKEALRHSDPYVRWNAAYGLVGQRVCCDEAAEAFHEVLKEKKKIMWQEQSFFRYLAPSKHVHQADYPNFPQVMDHLVRLELLQTLAFLNDPRSHEATVDFLQKCVKELRGVGMTLLLTEGEEEGMDLIRECLYEKNPQVRISAALLLSLWGRDPEALQTLYEAYGTAPRPLKEIILEGLGRVGDAGSLPFLVEQMSSNSSNLRLIAASSLLITLRS